MVLSSGLWLCYVVMPTRLFKKPCPALTPLKVSFGRFFVNCAVVSSINEPCEPVLVKTMLWCACFRLF